MSPNNNYLHNLYNYAFLPFILRIVYSNFTIPTIWNTWWYDYILITNLMHWLLFIHKILFSSTRFKPQVLIFRRIQLYTCSIWYCHSLWEFVVACRYTARVITDCRGKVVGRAYQVDALPTTFPLQSVLTQAVYRQATTNSRREQPYAACIQLYPPEDEHLRLKTCRGK